MKTFDFTGFIKFEYDSFDKIKLVQTDGFKIDLVNRYIVTGKQIGRAHV